MFFPSAVIGAVASVIASTSNNDNTTSKHFFPYLFEQCPVLGLILSIFFTVLIFTSIIEFFKKI